MPQRLRVLIAASYSVHYRLGVLQALMDDPRAEVSVAVGETVARGAVQLVEPIDPADLPTMQVHPTHTWRSLRWQPSLLRETLKPAYDVVVWDPSMHCLTMWASSLLLRARRRTLAYWGLGWTRTHGQLKERVKVRAFRLAHGFLTYGSRSAELAAKAGYPPESLHVVGNSIIDTAEARDVAGAGLPSPEPLVLGVALRLEPRKRVDLLIDAAARLQASGTSVRVLILGDGTARADLQARAERSGVDVEVLGAQYSASEIADYYRRIHVSVIPGHAGLTVTQSLMHGRPVVTHDDPAHHAAEWEALRADSTGFFFTRGDLDGLVRAIDLVHHRLDVDAPQVARACRDDYERHGSPAAHAERVLNTVRTIHRRHMK